MKKICSECKTEKETTEFHKKHSTRDGLCSQCKTCRLSYMKKYHKENKEMLSQKSRLYHEKNKDVLKEYAKRYRENNREYLREKNKLWRESKKANHLYKAQCSTGHYYVGSTTQGMEERSKEHFRYYGSQKTTLCRHCEKHSLSREDLEWIVIKEFESPKEMKLAEQKMLQKLSEDPLLLNQCTAFGEESLKKDRARQRERRKDPKIRAEQNARQAQRERQRRQEDPEYRERQNAYSRAAARERRRNNPEWCEKVARNRRERYRKKSQDPEWRKEESAKATARFQRKKQEDPEWYEEYKARNNASRREKDTPERRKAAAEWQREYRKTEKYVEYKRRKKESEKRKQKKLDKQKV